MLHEFKINLKGVNEYCRCYLAILHGTSKISYDWILVEDRILKIEGMSQQVSDLSELELAERQTNLRGVLF